MTYDQWKTRSPYDDYDDGDDYDPARDCEHDHYEIDVCTGRASCDCCDTVWYCTVAEIDAELDRQANYDRDLRRDRRREFWRKLTLPIRWPIFRLLERVWPRKSLSVLTDDEIPF